MKRIIKYGFTIILLSILWGVIVLFGTLNGWWHKPITTNKDTESFIAAAKEHCKTEFVGNFAMAIIKDGMVEKEIFYAHNKPVDRNTIFQVSSLSKFVSAVGIMKLVELGKIQLDTPVSRYLTRWQLPPSEFDNEQVTVRRLLGHTAGLTDELGYNGFENQDAVQTLEASLTKAKDADNGISGAVKVGIEPNSSWKYSGGGFTLLQLIVEETSGQSFNEFMTTNVFKPLNMTSSAYILNDSLNGRLCAFYSADKTTAPRYYYTSLAATSLYTSLADLETFFQLFLTGKNGEPIGRGIFKPETLNSMREGHGNMMGAEIYGLGCMLYIDIENKEDIFGHDGKSTPPINTAIRINPVSGDGIIVLETGNPDLATRIASDWVFLKTGKVDTLLFTMILDKAIKIALFGLLFIVLLVIGIGRKRRKTLLLIPVILASCGKKQIPEAKSIWRTEYVRDTSTALCNRITNADSAIVYMNHLFVPLFSENGIMLNRAVEQTAIVLIPGVASSACIIQNYYCPTYLVGKDVEVAFSLFAHPSQLQEWRNLSKSFTGQDREWNLYVIFSGIYCERSLPLKIKNGKIIWAQ